MFCRILAFMVCLVMAVQVGIGLVWLVRNYNVEPAFGDIGEYLTMGETMVLDEYRPILFPLTLRVFKSIGWRLSHTDTLWPTLLMTVQTLFNLLGIFYYLLTHKRVFQLRVNRWLVVLFGLYVWTTPMIMWINVNHTGPDSLAMTFLLFLLAGLDRFLFSEKLTGKQTVLTWAEICISYIIQALLRADRTYHALACILICILIKAIKDRKKGKSCRMLVPTLSAVLSLCLVLTVNHFTQTPGSYGRPKTDLSFIMLDRIAWPHMAENYDDLPEDIREIVSFEEAQKFDSHNNNVMYSTALVIRDAVGEEKASDVYRRIAETVWRNEAPTVLKEIGDDILTFAGFPFSLFVDKFTHSVQTNHAWNLSRMCSKTPKLSVFCEDFYLYSFTACMLIVAGIYLLSPEKWKYRTKVGSIAVMSILVVLWYSLGDGAPPNERYVLMGIMAWEVLMVKMLLALNTDTQASRT